MLKLELDWAGDEAPRTGVVSNAGDDVTVIVRKVADEGPSGWPVYAVYASREEWAPAYREAMELDAWLETVYGQQDEDERQELLDAADVV
jgi:hypothetical protein